MFLLQGSTCLGLLTGLGNELFRQGLPLPAVQILRIGVVTLVICWDFVSKTFSVGMPGERPFGGAGRRSYS